MLTCIQNYIEPGDQKINELQVRFNKLPNIFNRYDTAQSELELSDNTDHSGDSHLKISTTKLKQNSTNCYTRQLTRRGPDKALHVAVCQETVTSLHVHMLAVHTSNCQL
jgi:hypothetical protein